MDNGASSYRRFLDGDDQGIAEIVGEYKDGLILYINHYVGNVFAAEELAEDTFFRLMTKKPKFAGKSSFKSWLYAIARHIALDHLRHRGRKPTVPLEDVEHTLCEAQSLENAYIKEEDKRTVHKALSALSADYRAVLWLTYFEGFSSRETAKILGKSDRQTANLLYRAKQSLKAKLEKEGFVYENL